MFIKPRVGLLIGIGSSTLYTLVIAGFIYYHLVEIPAFLINQ